MEAPMDKYSADAVRESLLSASISHPNVVVRQRSTRSRHPVSSHVDLLSCCTVL
jgi:hypothetical protein